MIPEPVTASVHQPIAVWAVASEDGRRVTFHGERAGERITVDADAVIDLE